MIKTYFKYWTQRVFFRHVFLIARSNRTNGNQILLEAILYRTIFINFISHIKDCEGLVLIDVNTSAQVWSVKKGLFFVTFLVTPITSNMVDRKSPTTVICKLLTEVISPRGLLHLSASNRNYFKGAFLVSILLTSVPPEIAFFCV